MVISILMIVRIGFETAKTHVIAISILISRIEFEKAKMMRWLFRY